MAFLLLYSFSLGIAVGCHGQVVFETFRLTKIPDGHVAHPKYVLVEHAGVDSKIACAARCSIKLLCSHFVLFGTTCLVVSKLVLAKTSQAFGNATGQLELLKMA